MKRRAGALAAFCLAVGLAGVARAGEVLSTYALVAQDPKSGSTVLLVRSIVAGAQAACPSITVDGQDMAARTRLNPDAARFPVTVCEVAVAADATVALAGQNVPTFSGLSGDTLRIAAFGDTGCNPEQDCASEWPFPALAADAAAQHPDLVIHLGDYDYRGTPSRRSADAPRVYDGCVPGEGESYVSLADLANWQNWQADFFVPAAPLLRAAPWVAVRGNHELCSRGGDGWFFFLDPHSVLLDPLRGEQRCDVPVVTMQPYSVSVGGLDLVVADTSDGCDVDAWQDLQDFDYQVRTLAPDLAQAGALANGAGSPVWLLAHRPIWSAFVGKEGETMSDGSETWQRTLDAALGGSLAEGVVMLLSGHMHEAQALVFDGPRPPQLIIGNGGTRLDNNVIALPVSARFDGLAGSGWVVSPPSTPAAHGYLAAEVDDALHWQGTVTSHAGATAAPLLLMTCELLMRDGGLCVPPAP
jgi:hypothetical protein